MHPRSHWLLLLLSLLLASGDAAHGQTAVLDRELPSVEGLVLNTTNGAPIPGASVAMHCQYLTGRAGECVPIATVTSDREGRFRFVGITPGSYLFLATAPGFLTVSGTEVPSAVVSQGGEARRRVEIGLTAVSGLAGHVISEDRTPVPGIEVVAYIDRTPARRSPSLQEVARVRSGPDGSYAFSALEAGKYYFSAIHTSAVTDMQSKIAFRRYFPGVSNVESAAAITVSAGQHLDGFTIPMPEATNAFSLSGVINPFPALQQREQATLLLSGTTLDRPINDIPFDRRDGSFKIDGLIPGPYTLRLFVSRQIANGVLLRRLAAQEVVEISARAIRDVVLSALPLSVTVELDLPPEEQAPPAVTVKLSPSRLGDILGPPCSITAKASGKYSIVDCSPIAYGFEADLPEGYYLDSATFNGVDVALGAAVDLRTGSSGGTLHVKVRRGGASVAGSVLTSSRADPKLSVALIPKDLDPGGMFASNLLKLATVEGGKFTIRDLRPGRYYVAAVPFVPSPVWQEPNFLAALVGRMESITLDRDEFRTNLNLTPAEIADLVKQFQ